MVKIVRQDQKFNPEIGDLVYDHDNIICGFTDLGNPTPIFGLLNFLSSNPFMNLQKMGVSLEYLRDTKYGCIFNPPNTYFGIVPRAIRTNCSGPYRVNFLKNKQYDWIFDTEWQNSFRDSILKDNSIVNSFLGTGYNYGTLPSDGSIEKVLVDIELSNGDYIIASTFEWFNK